MSLSSVSRNVAHALYLSSSELIQTSELLDRKSTSLIDITTEDLIGTGMKITRFVLIHSCILYLRPDIVTPTDAFI